MKGKKRVMKLTLQQEKEEIAELDDRIEAGKPEPGSNPLALARPQPPCYAGVRTFEDLPLSRFTRAGLKESKYTNLTAIQRAALPHALCGRDVLGAAKTGSGKTLAFTIPLLERLYRSRWAMQDGLGGLIICPTRELALQIFEELRKVGRHHTFSAGLLIGGKDVGEEASRVQRLNILVATPGRLLQHMDETAGFDCSNLRVLVLDEADRILDMGFREALDAIVDNLPRQRQTMLFSATQTRSVKDLARLSLRDPERLSVHAESAVATPAKLRQVWVEVPAEGKLNMLWSFLKTHTRQKTIVFLSTCKQVRFVFEAFRRLRPGIPLRCLHGKMHQMRRMAAYYEFCEAKGMALFATDIAARGLDFPAVDWVVQADCPDDVATYIHRAGRTARYTSGGKAMLMLTPHERPEMVKALAEAKIPIKQIRPNPDKQQQVSPALQALLSKVPEVKEMAQRAIVSYLRCLNLQSNKALFDVHKVPVADLALSMGLASVPKLRFLKTSQSRTTAGDMMDEADRAANTNRQNTDSGKDTNGDGGGSDESSDEGGSGDEGAAGRAESGSEESDDGAARRVARSDGDGAALRAALDGAAGSGEEAGGAEGEPDDFLVVRRKDVFGARTGQRDDEAIKAAEAAAEAAARAAAERRASRKKKKKKLKIRADDLGPSSKRVVFDDEGNEISAFDLLPDAAAEGKVKVGDGGLRVAGAATAEERFERVREELRARDKADREAARQLRQEKRRLQRQKRREAEGVGAPVAMLGGASGSDESGAGSEGDVEGGSDSGVEAEVVVGAKRGGAERDRGGKRRKVEGMSLEEQERLALAMLG
ncbi:unnamed protein product [Pedinophyceae sp. YPF-701]|nr:unnamed protein product [Pedinophyceae sp. YPF-701]